MSCPGVFSIDNRSNLKLPFLQCLQHFGFPTSNFVGCSHRFEIFNFRLCLFSSERKSVSRSTKIPHAMLINPYPSLKWYDVSWHECYTTIKTECMYKTVKCERPALVKVLRTSRGFYFLSNSSCTCSNWNFNMKCDAFIQTSAFHSVSVAQLLFFANGDATLWFGRAPTTAGLGTLPCHTAHSKL